MSGLLTQNPTALRFLMSETIFNLGIEDKLVEYSPIESDSIEKNSLISDNKAAELLFWGANDRHILFLIRNQSEDYFSAEAEGAFLKTLNALKLSIQDVAVLNLDRSEKSFDEIKEVLKTKICIYCVGQIGADPKLVFNTFIKIEDIAHLYTYSFEEMLTDIDKKRAFWNAIKEINVI